MVAIYHGPGRIIIEENYNSGISAVDIKVKILTFGSDVDCRFAELFLLKYFFYVKLVEGIINF
jgi:hypothetical protein